MYKVHQLKSTLQPFYQSIISSYFITLDHELSFRDDLILLRFILAFRQARLSSGSSWLQTNCLDKKMVSRQSDAQDLYCARSYP
jgi:hypothetical protein